MRIGEVELAKRLAQIPHGKGDKARLVRFTGRGIPIVLKRCADLAVIGHVHPHQLRHTFASQFLEGGGPEGDLLRLGGWERRRHAALRGPPAPSALTTTSIRWASCNGSAGSQNGRLLPTSQTTRGVGELDPVDLELLGHREWRRPEDQTKPLLPLFWTRLPRSGLEKLWLAEPPTIREAS